MRVIVLSTYQGFSVAQKLLEGEHTATVVSALDCYDGKEGSFASVKKEIRRSDFIIAIVDAAFVSNTLLMSVLKDTLADKKTKRSSIIPVVFGDAEAPRELPETNLVRLDSSRASFEKAKTDIGAIFEQYYLRALNDQSGFVREKLWLLLAIGLAIPFVGIMTYFNQHPMEKTPMDYWLLIICILCFLSCCAVFYLHLLTTYQERKRRSESEDYLYSRRIKQAITPKETEPFPTPERKDGEMADLIQPEAAVQETAKTQTALELMGLNLENIDKYYKWSQKQAKLAFGLALGMCIAGLTLFAAAVLLPILFKLSIEVAVITAVGGGIVEVIAGTSLFVYKSSVEQLSHYHKALHEDERFLSSVNLLGEFSTPEKRDEVLYAIIKSEIDMNLAGSGAGNESEKKKDDKGRKA